MTNNISWRDKDSSDLHVLRDGEKLRVGVMMRDAARFCDMCSGSGKIRDLSIGCPVCGGSGLLDAQGRGIDRDEVARGTAHTDATRGNDATMTDAEFRDKYVAADASARAKAAGSRPGFRMDNSPAGKAARQRTFDAMSEADDERENAWRSLEALKALPDDTFNANVATLSKLPEGPISQSDAQRIKDSAYAEYEANLRNAYRNLK
jgi:hypothetical protein